MDGADLIVTLIAQSSLTNRGFALKHNGDRRALAENASFDDHNLAPRYDPNNNDEDNKIRLTFSDPPKKPQVGWTFGRSPKCDVQLVDLAEMKEDRRYVRYVSDRVVVLMACRFANASLHRAYLLSSAMRSPMLSKRPTYEWL